MSAQQRMVEEVSDVAFNLGRCAGIAECIAIVKRQQKSAHDAKRIGTIVRALQKFAEQSQGKV